MVDTIKIEEKKSNTKMILGVVSFALILVVAIISLVKCDSGKDGIDNYNTFSDDEYADTTEEYNSDDVMLTYKGIAKELTVTFSLHKNDHHPEGHVIVKKIQIRNEFEAEEYSVIYTDNEYIEKVHNELTADSKAGVVRLDGEVVGDELFKIYFRTAEAMIMAYYKTSSTEISTQELKEARDRMEGRQHGQSFGEPFVEETTEEVVEETIVVATPEEHVEVVAEDTTEENIETAEEQITEFLE